MKKTYPCNYCDKIYHAANRLRVHIENNHNGPYICQYCNKQCKTLKSKSMHEMSCRMSDEKREIWKQAIKWPIGRMHSEETKQKLSENKIQFLQNNPQMVPYRLYHSSKWSYPERVFRKALEDHNISGWHYNYDFGIYQFDFAFPELKLDVEIDGPTHKLKNIIRKDSRRDEWTRSQGWNVIRFTSESIMKNLDDCIEIIKMYTCIV